MLLAHSIRKGGESAFKAVESAASLQRTCVNGSDVFCTIFSHTVEDLTTNGTSANLDDLPATGGTSERNKALQKSVSIITSIATSDANNVYVNADAAIRQWRCLCHLAVINVGIITELGFGVVELLDGYKAVRQEEGSATERQIQSSSLEGIGGIRLRQSSIVSVGFGNTDRSEMCVTLTAQVLSLLDAFVFPKNSKNLKRGYGLALVRASDSRLGQSQGPLIASLIRLSVLLLAHLEPCSLHFLYTCGRLRTLCRWLLALIRENNTAIGGLPTPFAEATAHLDRIVLAVVLHAHRALEKCARILTVFEANHRLFKKPEDHKKACRRVIKASHELREMILLVNNTTSSKELLRCSLAPMAYKDLIEALSWMGPSDELPAAEATRKSSSVNVELVLRKFLSSKWVRRWHDVETREDGEIIPEMVSSGQVYEGSTCGGTGRKAINDLVKEGKQIVKDYEQVRLHLSLIY